MPKSVPINAHPGNRTIPRPIGEPTAEPDGQTLIDRASSAAVGVFFAIAFGGMLIWGINREIYQIDFHLLVSALRATPTSSLAAALAATALSYLALVGYDASGLRYARARAPLKTILLASFCGFAVGNCIGLGALSGGAVRYRLYTAAGLSPGQIARAILFISIAFGVGLGVIAALGLLLDAREVSGLLGASLVPLRAGAATVLALAVGFMLFCTLRPAPWRRGSIEINAPDTTLVLTQLIFTTIDVLAAAATLWVLFPSVGISFFSFAAIYAVALALGVLSHIPGGLGVFELAILYTVGRNPPVNDVAAALVIYRAIYFLLPLLLSTVLLANVELQRSLDTAMGRRVGRVAALLAPYFLAAATFVVGAILVVSGAMPAFIDRLQILQVAVPLWAVEVSHFLASIAGLILLFAAYGLRLRLDGAWWLALCMTLLSIPLSLIKGLAVVAPSVSIMLLIGLVAGRRQFSRRASLLSQPLAWSWFIAISCVIAATLGVLFFAFRNVEYAHELWWQFEFDATAPRALRAVLAVAMLGLALGVWQLLRPAQARPAPPTKEEIDHARQIAAKQSRPDALLALMGDKSFVFSESGGTFLMFATRGRTWVALGDPVGPPTEWPDLVWRFIELADSHGGKAAFYQIPPSSLSLYLDAGLEVLKLGEMASVFLPSFTLEGSARADLRYAVRRGERDGLRFEMVQPDRIASVIEEIERISNDWLVKYAGEQEKGFSVAAFHRDYVLSQPIALLRQDGEAVAFATVMKTELRQEVTVGLMRHRPGPGSRYAMEYLFVRLIEFFRDHGYRSLCLGMVPLSGLRAHPLAPYWHRVAHVTWSLGRPFYNFQGLRTFKGKFDPIWEPRYLAASGWFGPYLALIDIVALIGGGMRFLTNRRVSQGGRYCGLMMAAAMAIALGTLLISFRPASALEASNLSRVHEFNPISAMRSLVVLFSDAHGWTSVLNDAAVALTRDGALVVGVDLPDYLARLDAHSGEACHDVVGDIDSISRRIQREHGNTQYLTPIIAGIGEGGALAPAILAHAPAATIAGAISFDPAVAVHTRIPLCSTPEAKMDPAGGFVYGPWRSLPGFWVVAFPDSSNGPARQRVAMLRAAGTPVDIARDAGSGAAEALAALMHSHLPSVLTLPQTAIATLPLIELPAEPSGPLLAIVLSGDGGWRDLDKTISEKLRSAGVSVVGWDSLRYFWNQKSPEQVARDLGAIVDTYLSRWGGSKVVLVGYSFGADVLPFAYDRLPSETKAHIVQLSLLGFSTAADFEIRVAGLVGGGPSKEALPTEPALAPIDPSRIQCFYGTDEDETACRFLEGKAEVIRTTGGHHFDGNYSALAQRILDGFRRRAGL
jgi:phosphatidylglycerol lysyltransferase